MNRPLRALIVEDKRARCRVARSRAPPRWLRPCHRKSGDRCRHESGSEPTAMGPRPRRLLPGILQRFRRALVARGAFASRATPTRARRSLWNCHSAFPQRHDPAPRYSSSTTVASASITSCKSGVRTRQLADRSVARCWSRALAATADNKTTGILPRRASRLIA